MYNFKKVVGHTHYIDDVRKATIRRDNDHFVITVSDRITNVVIAEYKLGNVDDKYVVINKSGRTVAVRERFADILECLNKALYKKSTWDFFRIEELADLF